MIDEIKSKLFEVPDKEVENKDKEQNWKNSSGVNINLLDLH